MSAVVCGKRSLFDDLHASPPNAKRIRCGGGSPIRFPSVSPASRSSPSGASEAAGAPANPQSPASSQQDLLSQLRQLFPDMDGQLLERVLDACGSNLDSAIKSLNDLRLGSSEHSPSNGEHLDNASVSSSQANHSPPGGPLQGTSAGVNSHAESSSAHAPAEGMEWVELLVREMMNASDLDDARARATRALEAFEKAVTSRSTAMLQKENGAFREQLQTLLRDNQILKRACIIQHERQLEHESRARELEQLKQLCAKYQEQLRSLEMSNYTLTLHLRKAQEGSSMPGRFHPDVF